MLFNIIWVNIYIHTYNTSTPTPVALLRPRMHGNECQTEDHKCKMEKLNFGKKPEHIQLGFTITQEE